MPKKENKRVVEENATLENIQNERLKVVADLDLKKKELAGAIKKQEEIRKKYRNLNIVIQEKLDKADEKCAKKLEEAGEIFLELTGDNKKLKEDNELIKIANEAIEKKNIEYKIENNGLEEKIESATQSLSDISKKIELKEKELEEVKNTLKENKVELVKLSEKVLENEEEVEEINKEVEEEKEALAKAVKERIAAGEVRNMLREAETTLKFRFKSTGISYPYENLKI